MRVLNFNAGPATLPLSALELARDELLDFGGTGMSIMEHSHRGKDFEAVHAETKSLMREVIGVPDTHEILFVQGGASQLFAQIPMNFAHVGKCADYVVTGAWGEKAVSEAKVVAKMLNTTTHVAASTGEGDARVKTASPHALTCHAARRAPSRSLALALPLSHRAPQAARREPGGGLDHERAG